MAISISATLANTMLQVLADQIDSDSPTAGLIRIYSGTQPETPGGEITDQVLLAELTCSIACGTVEDRTLTLADIAEEDNAPASGIAAWGRLVDGSGDAIADFDVGDTESNAVLKLTSTSIYAGGIVRITAAAITL